MLQEQPDKGGRGNRGQGVERVPAKLSKQQGGHSSHRKVHGKDCDHCYLRNVRISIVSKLEQAANLLGSVLPVYQACTNSFGREPSARPFRCKSDAGLAPICGPTRPRPAWDLEGHCRTVTIQAMNTAAAPEAMRPSSELELGSPVSHKGRILAWAAWDWGSAAFNAVMTTFVFTVYLTSEAFGGDAFASEILGYGLAIAGLAIAVLAPVTGQRSDTGGRRGFWLGVNSVAV